MGISEILIILVVALLVVGPDKLPSAARSISKGLRDLRKQTREIQDTLEDDTEIGSAIRDLKSALRGDEVHTPPRKPPGPMAMPAASEQGKIAGHAGAAAGTTAAGAAAQEGSDDAPADAPAFPAPVIRTPTAAVARGGSAEDIPKDTPKDTVDGDPEAGSASGPAGTPDNDIAEKKAHG